MIKHLEDFDYRVSRVVKYWIDNDFGSFITEFVIDTFVSYSKAERRCFKGPRGKYLKSLKTWIKMLLCEKGVIPMN